MSNEIHYVFFYRRKKSMNSYIKEYESSIDSKDIAQKKESSSSQLCLQISFYRQLKYKFQFLKLRESAQGVSKVMDFNQDRFNQVIESKSFNSISIATISVCLEELLNLFYHSCQKYHKQNDKTKKEKKKVQHKNFEKQLQSETLINALSIFFLYNQKHSLLLGNENVVVFTIYELAHIFKSQQIEIQNYQKVYMNFKQKVIIKYLEQIENLVLCIFIMKIRLIIQKKLRKLKQPTEEQLRLSTIKLDEFEIKWKNTRQADKQLKILFSKYCQEPIYLSDLSYLKKAQLNKQMNQLLNLELSEIAQVQYLIRIAKSYMVKFNSVKKQYRRLKFNLKQMLKKEKSAKQNESRKELTLQLFNYYRYKQKFAFMNQISTKIEKTHNIFARTYLQEYSQQEIRSIFEDQQRNYVKFILPFIRFQFQCDQVMFFDFHAFYKTQFIVYSALQQKKVENKQENRSFIPCQDVLFSLITGITSKRIQFHEIVLKPITMFQYCHALELIFNQFGSKIPKYIVIFVNFRLQTRQVDDLVNFSQLLQKTQRYLIILPTTDYIPNINFHYFRHLKYQLFNKYSQNLLQLTDQQLYSRVIAVVQQTQKGIEGFQVISNLLKKLYFTANGYKLPDFLYTDWDAPQKNNEHLFLFFKWVCDYHKIKNHNFAISKFPRKKSLLILFKADEKSTIQQKELKNQCQIINTQQIIKEKIFQTEELSSFIRAEKIIIHKLTSFAQKDIVQWGLSRIYIMSKNLYELKILRDRYRTSQIHRAIFAYTVNQILAVLKSSKQGENLINFIRQMQQNIKIKYSNQTNNFLKDEKLIIYLDENINKLSLKQAFQKYFVIKQKRQKDRNIYNESNMSELTVSKANPSLQIKSTILKNGIYDDL